MSSARHGTSARQKGASAFTAGGSARQRGPSAFTSSGSARPSSSARPSTSSRPSASSSSRRSSDTSALSTSRKSTSSKSSSSTRKSRKSESRTREPHVPGASKVVPQESLMDLVRKRFTDDVFQSAARAHPGWKVLIVDQPGMKVVNAAVGMYDIMEQQVSIVESLEKKRAPFKDMAAIYVIAPTIESVKRLLDDYADKEKVLYGKSVFLYFLGPIPSMLMKEIKQCKQLVKRLKALAEINIDFLIREKRAFTLDLDDPFVSLFNGGGMSSVELKTAEKLVTLCATLNEFPYIRYKQSSQVCSSIASIFKMKMDEYIGANRGWWYHGGGNCPSGTTERDRSTLLLLDRSNDCLTPLMHDFNYQAMVNDLLAMDGDKITYKANSADNPNVTENKDVLLNDKDKLWVEMRGEHIAKVIEVLSERIKEVVNSSTNNVGRKDKGNNMSLAQLAATLKQLPEYREVMSKLSQHMHLAHECMDKFNKGNLIELSDVEQTFATGKDDSDRTEKLSETISRCETSLLRIRDPTARLRLILIAIISQDGLTRGDKDRLLRAAKLGREELQTLESITQLGIRTINKNPEATQVEKKKGFLGGLRNRSNSVDSDDSDSEYASSRYKPPMKRILTDLVSNQLSTQEYPSVVPMPMMTSSSSTGIASSARRRGKSATEGSRKRGGATDKWGKQQSKSSGPAHYDGARNIVFMVGGLSFSELRVARKVMETNSREIIMGSTKFVSPNEFIEDLKTLID